MKRIIPSLAGIALIASFGCAKKEVPPDQSAQLPVPAPVVQQPILTGKVVQFTVLGGCDDPRYGHYNALVEKQDKTYGCAIKINSQDRISSISGFNYTNQINLFKQAEKTGVIVHIYGTKLENDCIAVERIEYTIPEPLRHRMKQK